MRHAKGHEEANREWCHQVLIRERRQRVQCREQQTELFGLGLGTQLGGYGRLCRSQVGHVCGEKQRATSRAVPQGAMWRVEERDANDCPVPSGPAAGTHVSDGDET